MTVDRTFTVRIPYCPEHLDAQDIATLIFDDLAVLPNVKEVNDKNMVYIAIRKGKLAYPHNVDTVIRTMKDEKEIADYLDMGSLRDGDEIYEAKLVSKVVRKPKVIKTSELVLEDVK